MDRNLTCRHLNTALIRQSISTSSQELLQRHKCHSKQNKSWTQKCVPTCDQHWTQWREGKQACKDTMESYPIRDESTQRDRFTLKHKHNIGTDLEAPVVWLLLRGRERKTKKAKETEKGRGGEKDRVWDIFSCVKLLTQQKIEQKKRLDRTRTERKDWENVCHSVPMWRSAS